MFAIGTGQLLGDIGQVLDGCSQIVLARMHGVDVHQHQAGEFVGVFNGTLPARAGGRTRRTVGFFST